MRSYLVPVALLVTLIAAGRPALLGVPAFHPAKYREGALPDLPPPTVVGGGEVMLELDVTSAGAVREAKALRTTPPYTAALIASAKSWRFTPAEVENENPNPAAGERRFKAVDSTVLLAAVIRAPSLLGPTLGDTPRDIGSESDTTPFPFSTVMPLFPPRARDAGIVLIETTVDAGGAATGNRILHSSSSFDEAALTAIRQWRFRPARILGSSAPTLAYIIMGFRQPALGAQPGAPPSPR
jgi:TonB family protein